jgi:hypothetical protein
MYFTHAGAHTMPQYYSGWLGLWLPEGLNLTVYTWTSSVSHTPVSDQVNAQAPGVHYSVCSARNAGT